MSSKGLIELIILNQGLSVGIINETGEFPSYVFEFAEMSADRRVTCTVFSIFVLEAL